MGAGAGKLVASEAPASLATAKKLFVEIDSDANSLISIEELTQSVQANRAELKGDWGDVEIRAAFASADTDGDGSLDIAEFSAALKLLTSPPADLFKAKGPRSKVGTKQAKKAEQMRMLDEARKMAAGASATLEAIGMSVRGAIEPPEEVLTPAQLERRRSVEMNERVSPLSR